MNCRKCGAQIGREHRREDGVYVCPNCGAAYRARPKAGAEDRRSGKTAPEAGGQNRSRVRTGASGGKRSSAARLLRRIRWRRVAAAVACLALLVAVALILPRALGGRRAEVPSPTDAPLATPTPSATAAPTPTPTPAPVPASVRFRAVGDVMSHKLQLRHAYQEDGSFDYAPQFEYVRDALSKADYTIANLELSIAVGDDYSSYPRFRAPAAILDALRDCGVDLLTTANNHTLDGLFEGLTHTLDELDARGFDHLGTYRTAEEAAQPLVVDINGIRFGFLAYTRDTNDNEKNISSKQAAFCVKYLDKADFAADVRELRDLGAEVVICLPHWGEEGRRSVPSSCKRYAREMVEAGVDIILGSHPHVVLPIDHGELEVDGEKKDVLIAWSMGNFISYMASRYMDSGIIVDFTVSRDETGKIHIGDVGYVPVYVWGNPNVFHLLCTGDFYSNRPSGMSDYDYRRMRQSAGEIANMIGQDGITMLAN